MASVCLIFNCQIYLSIEVRKGRGGGRGGSGVGGGGGRGYPPASAIFSYFRLLVTKDHIRRKIPRAEDLPAARATSIFREHNELFPESFLTQQTEFPGEFSYKSRSLPKGITATRTLTMSEAEKLQRSLARSWLELSSAERRNKKIIRRVDCLRRENVDTIH